MSRVILCNLCNLCFLPLYQTRTLSCTPVCRLLRRRFPHVNQRRFATFLNKHHAIHYLTASLYVVISHVSDAHDFFSFQRSHRTRCASVQAPSLKTKPHASFGNPLSFIVSRVSAVLSIHSPLYRLSLLPLRENTVYGIPDDIYHTEITVDTYMQNTRTADRKNKNVTHSDENINNYSKSKTDDDT